ncbi:SDR family oxidoreductase [Amycolatopsis sp. YIM 10]|uniref:SDR family oxidoreductase n=1 Tax=Amycolatopsis sp. YIM 10 TaxID=2653857 RepID=UPI00129087D0|nr:SDR family oxidoreductase [Amycolatopsis sp. YIM 10]QFU88626.1 3-oxoacyl-[acyl-carrier-protein] reductase FabG [Amycolatopsis sp. YIM 10]
MDVTECRAIVTGAASGLGRACCLGLAEAGAEVVAVDSDRKGLDSLAGDRIFVQEADVTRECEVASAVDAAFARLGRVDVLVNFAGIYRDGLLVKDIGEGDFVSMPLAQWRAVIETDLTGTFLPVRETALRMVRDGVRPGVLITVSSVSRNGNPGQGNYSAAKAGVVAFTRSVALELAPHGIRAAAIAPGFIDTPILSAMDPDRLSAQVDEIPARRLGTPAEIFAGVRFAIECEYFTGRCLEIDGGLSF